MSIPDHSFWNIGLKWNTLGLCSELFWLKIQRCFLVSFKIKTSIAMFMGTSAPGASVSHLVLKSTLLAWFQWQKCKTIAAKSQQQNLFVWFCTPKEIWMLTTIVFQSIWLIIQRHSEPMAGLRMILISTKRISEEDSAENCMRQFKMPWLQTISERILTKQKIKFGKFHFTLMSIKKTKIVQKTNMSISRPVMMKKMNSTLKYYISGIKMAKSSKSVEITVLKW